MPENDAHVTIKDRNMMIEGVKNLRSSFLFSMAKNPHFKKNCGHRAGTTQAASIESVNLCEFVGVARGSFWRGGRLEAIDPIG